MFSSGFEVLFKFLHSCQLSVFGVNFSCILGWFSDSTGTFDLSFFSAGVIIAACGLLLVIIPFYTSCTAGIRRTDKPLQPAKHINNNNNHNNNNITHV